MIKLSSLNTKNKKRYDKLIKTFISEGDSEPLATTKAIENLKSSGTLNEKKYKTYTELMEEGEIEDLNNDGEIDSADLLIALEELEITTRLEDDLIEILLVSAEEDIIPVEMIYGLFELIADHADLTGEDGTDETEVEESVISCPIEEVRALALIKKKGGKRRVRCTSGPNKGRIRVAGKCGKKVDIRLSRKLKRSKKKISSAKKSLSAKRAARTSKRRGTR